MNFKKFLSSLVASLTVLSTLSGSISTKIYAGSNDNENQYAKIINDNNGNPAELRFIYTTRNIEKLDICISISRNGNKLKPKDLNNLKTAIDRPVVSELLLRPPRGNVSLEILDNVTELNNFTFTSDDINKDILEFPTDDMSIYARIVGVLRKGNIDSGNLQKFNMLVEKAREQKKLREKEIEKEIEENSQSITLAAAGEVTEMLNIIGDNIENSKNALPLELFKNIPIAGFFGSIDLRNLFGSLAYMGIGLLPNLMDTMGIGLLPNLMDTKGEENVTTEDLLKKIKSSGLLKNTDVKLTEPSENIISLDLLGNAILKESFENVKLAEAIGSMTLVELLENLPIMKGKENAKKTELLKKILGEEFEENMTPQELSEGMAKVMEKLARTQSNPKMKELFEKSAAALRAAATATSKEEKAKVAKDALNIQKMSVAAGKTVVEGVVTEVKKELAANGIIINDKLQEDSTSSVSKTVNKDKESEEKPKENKPKEEKLKDDKLSLFARILKAIKEIFDKIKRWFTSSFNAIKKLFK